MSLSVMFMVLLAATLHASWNFLIKQNDNKHISMAAVVLGHTPFAIAVLLVSPLPKIESLPYIILGAVLHTGYQLFLLYSYRIGDLSQVYPLARGIAPLIVTAVSIVFLGVHLYPIQLSAIVIISTGIMSLVMVRRNDGLRNYRAASMAIATGGFIAAYSLVDGLGARVATTALGFYGSLSILNAILFSVIITMIRPGTIKTVIQEKYKLALSGGFASFTAYAIVIWAFTMAPIAAVTALRETSIVVALLLGVFVLKEPLDLIKVFASMFTLLGAGLLRLNR
ncbi:MAG: EamA family transporter [Desulfobacterium sp.]|nr:EamA family transporter [Desulfobacterium sp.]